MFTLINTQGYCCAKAWIKNFEILYFVQIGTFNEYMQNVLLAVKWYIYQEIKGNIR